TETSIGAGNTIEIVFLWTPGLGNKDLHQIFTSIQNLGTSIGNAGGPDGKNDNNDKSFPIFVKRLGVEAIPDRQKAPTGSDVNEGWALGDIKEVCPTGTNIARVACKVQPGSIVNFAYNVKNDGNWRDSYYGTVVDPPGQNNLSHRGYLYHFTPQNFTLDLNQTQSVVLQIIVPPKEWAGNNTNVGTNTVKVMWTSRLDPTHTNSNNPPADACDPALKSTCTNPSFPTTLVDVHHGLNATTNDTMPMPSVDVRIANVSSPVTFNVTLNNTGNADDTYTLTIENDTAQINSSWHSDIPAEVRVPRFSAKAIEFTLIPPTRTAKGLHEFNISFASKDDPDGKTHQTLRFAADVQQNFTITGTMDTGLIRVLPDQKAAYVLRITNDGNGMDNVTLTLENVPYLWTGSLSTRIAQVPAFSTIPVYVNVTPPPGTDENYQATFFVNATSQGPITSPPDQRSHFTLRADLIVLRGPNIRVTSNVKSSYVDPGNYTDYVLTITNTGNLRDQFNVAVNRTADLAWTATGTPSTVTLGKLESATETVRLTAPGSGAVGEATQIFVTVTATFDASIRNETTLEGRVSGPDLFIDSIRTNTTNPYSGDPVELNVLLGNAGNIKPGQNVTLKLYFVQDGVPSPIPGAEHTYAPSDLPGGRRLSEAFTWDTTNVKGSGVILARINEDKRIAEIEQSNNEASRAITLRTFDIRIIPAQGLSGLPGESVSYSDQPHVFLVTYNGNQPTEPVEITVTSEHGWGGSHQSIALPNGTAIPILVDIQIPESPGVPSDTLHLSVIPALRPQAIVTSSTVTTVLDADPPIVLGVTAVPASVNLGQSTTLIANVTDATGLTSVRAFVVRPDNVTDTYLLENKADDTWTHTQAFAIAGQYRMYVEAVDAAAGNKNTSRDTLVTFTVTPGSAPVIALAGNQPTTIHTGSFVRFNITDPLGIKDASYSIKGISYDMGRFPYQIDTSSFTQGQVEVTVTAHNVYDVATSQKFMLIVDNTPPGINKVTLEPTNPKANQDVTLRIETDTKVATVQVVIKKDGAILDTRSAIRTSPGNFELLLNPGEGSYTIDVTAKDVAGNTKLEEGAVSFTAKPKSPFEVPAAGLPLVALAAIVVATLRRRRS
ncbi:MAG: CARDB domain-containing protein, partial [Candidatus Thermoplasmatota archaeon]